MITAYTPTFGNSVLKLSSSTSLTVTLLLALSNLLWLPIMAALSDRTGRRPLLIACTLLAVLLWFSFIFGSYNGAMVPFVTEIMPADFRTTGFSLPYSLAAGVFGGFTPALSIDPPHRQSGDPRCLADDCGWLWSDRCAVSAAASNGDSAVSARCGGRA
jgi:MHS family citrate/tricarballylate:H+ symporter-like MFS transporter